MKLLHLAAAPLLALALVGSSRFPTDDEAPATADPRLESYLPLIAEFDRRRRVNVLFPNPQTLFDGLQAGFVNVGSGNLTFLRRDLVTRANGPLVFGRVYDSRIERNGDFGPGWRISLAEELHINDAEVIYVDGAGARRRFVAGSDGHRPLKPTPRHASTRIALGEDVATLRESDGTTRTFKPVGADGSWRLLSVDADGRRLDFRYRNGRLESVVHGRRTMFHIRRDGAGRIADVTDDHGRSVRYSYTAHGQLKDVYDVAGNLWWHEYDASGRLTTAIGANRQPYLEVRYGGQGRVQTSRTGREYTFAYGTGRTVVTEGAGQRHVFEHNADGTTVAFSSSSGVSWRVGLNANNRVKQLTLPTRTLDYDYDAAGRVTMVQESGDEGDHRQDFFYDKEDRLTSTRSLYGQELVAVSYGTRSVRITENNLGFNYDLTRSGRVAAVWDGAVRIDADYDRKGDLEALHYNGNSVRFQRDRLGRIVATTYPSGLRNRYLHDSLGNRRLVEFDGGASVAYRHDFAGNIVRADITEQDGKTRRQTTTVGSMNQVTRIAYNPGRTLDIDYDRMGRPIEFDDGVQRVTVEYDEHGTAKSLRVPRTGESLDLRRRRSPGYRTLAERRLAVFAGDVLGDPHPDYGPLRFAEATFHALPLDAKETSVPNLAAARDLFRAALPMFGGESYTISAFEKPSNPVFQPAEYRSTNCCVPYNTETCGPDGPGGGSSGPTPRQIAAAHGIGVKDSAVLTITTAAILSIFDDIVEVWRRHAPGITPVITSGSERAPRRRENSLHYSGNAIDLRTWGFSQSQIETIAAALLASIGDAEYDIIIKPDHLHVEYDPD